MAWEDIVGANSLSYTTPVLGVDDDLSNYRLKITDGVGNVYYTSDATAILRETNVYYAIEIDTGSAISDSDYGITDGTFRFITSRPGYDGAGPGYPLWEDDTQNTYAWYEGWLLKDGLSKASRQVDISQTGNYASLSGFSFKLRNMPLFWKFLEDNDIYTASKPVRFYVVINKKFYQCWDGAIDTTPYGETAFEIKCKDIFTRIHKPLPRLPITNTSYVDVGDVDNAKIIPVSFGDVPYAKLNFVKPTPKWVKLDTNYNENEIYCTNAYLYRTDVDGEHWWLDIWVVGKDVIEVDHFKDKYVFCKYGGSNPDNGILIKGSTGKQKPYISRPDTYVTLELANPLEDTTVSEFNANNNVPIFSGEGYSARTTETWYFSIAELDMVAVLSDGNVETIKTDSDGYPILYTYLSGSKEYLNVKSIITGYDLTTSNTYGRPYIEFASDAVTASGDFSYQYPIAPLIKNFYWDKNFSTITGDYGVAADKNRTTLLTLTQASKKAKRYTFGFLIDVRKMLELDANIEDMYIGYDFRIRSQSFSKPGILIEAVDGWGYIVEGLSSEKYIGKSEVAYLDWSRNMLPNFYYTRAGGNDNGESYVFELDDNNAGKLTSDVKDFVFSKAANGLIRCTFFLESSGSSKISATIDVKQIGVIAVTNINFNSDGLYAPISGETIDGLKTNTVYRTFKKILEDYDGISTSDIDYGNLPDVRDHWHVGRQITERKKSFDYLKELCEQSFVCILPSRNGKRLLTAWRDDTTTPISFTSDNIIRDSISKCDVSSLSKVYNDFVCKYHWDPGRDDYGRTVFVTKCWETAFPDEGTLDGSGNNLWKSYVGGVPSSAYIEAKEMWEACRDSYLRISSINTTDKNKTISELPWYVDTNYDNLGDTSGAGANSSAYRFLIECCEWLTRTKQMVTFSIPITETTIQYELLRPLIFSDPVYTNNVDRSGWITSIDIDPVKGIINIEATLDPREIANIGEGVIEEVGIYATDDTIEESGSQPDTITETGV